MNKLFAYRTTWKGRPPLPDVNPDKYAEYLKSCIWKTPEEKTWIKKRGWQRHVKEKERLALLNKKPAKGVESFSGPGLKINNACTNIIKELQKKEPDFKIIRRLEKITIKQVQIVLKNPVSIKHVTNIMKRYYDHNISVTKLSLIRVMTIISELPVPEETSDFESVFLRTREELGNLNLIDNT